MALITPSEVVAYGKLQLPGTQTAEQTSERNQQLMMLIEAAETSLFEQIGYRIDTIPAVKGTVEVTVPAWDTRPTFVHLPKRMAMLSDVTKPNGDSDEGSWELVGSGWRVRPLPERKIDMGVWRFSGEIGWAALPAAARTLLLTWVIDTFDSSGSVTQEVNEEGLTTIGFATSLPIWHQNYYLQSLMK